MTDEQLAKEVQNGNIQQFGLLVDRYEAKLLRYGRRFLNQNEEIEDIVQEVFLKAFKNIQSFDTEQKFSPWLYRIAHNSFVNLLRQRERRPLTIELDTLLSHPVYEDPAESVREQAEMKKAIEQGLVGLPAKYREVLTLHYFDNLAYKEIAEVLQVPLGTVGIRLKRAREALKKLMQPTLKDFE